MNKLLNIIVILLLVLLVLLGAIMYLRSREKKAEQTAIPVPVEQPAQQ